MVHDNGMVGDCISTTILCMQSTPQTSCTGARLTAYSLWQNLKFSPCLCLILGGGGRGLSPTVSWIKAQPGGLLQMNPQWATPWRGCTQLTRETAGTSHGPKQFLDMPHFSPVKHGLQLNPRLVKRNASTAIIKMLRHVFLKHGVHCSQGKGEVSSASGAPAPAGFHSRDVHAQKTTFTYYPAISRLFTSLL